MRRASAINLTVLLALGASLPLLPTASTVSASRRTTAPTGTQLEELKAPEDYFGTSMAVSGNTAIVTAPQPGGWAYVFTKDGAAWKQSASLRGSDSVSVGPVAISGNHAVVGGSGVLGRVYVFDRTTTTWKQAAKLTGSDTVAADFFGDAVAISGSTVVVGAIRARRVGRAYVFSEAATGWKQQAELAPPVAAVQGFGWAVAISGKIAVVGATGCAFVFTKTGAFWKPLAEIKDSDTANSGTFGDSLAISGNALAVGASGQNRVYVFTAAGGVWSQSAVLKGTDTTSGDAFGFSVSISGSTIAVGASNKGGGTGRAYVFERAGTDWNQVAELIGSDTSIGDSFGESVATSEDTTFVGAPSHAAFAGRVYVFAP
jgi:hypothetical protein